MVEFGKKTYFFRLNFSTGYFSTKNYFFGVSKWLNSQSLSIFNAKMIITPIYKIVFF